MTFERIERAAAIVARIDRRGVDDQHLLEQHPEPVGERMPAVGAGQEAGDGVDRLRACRRILAVARADRVALRRDLVLAGFDHRAQERQRVGEPAQFAERNAVVRARDIVEVGAERIVPLPALDLGRGHRLKRLQRPEPGVGRNAGDHIAPSIGEAGENAWGQGASDGFRHGDCFLGSRSHATSALSRAHGRKSGVEMRGAGKAGRERLRLPLGIGPYHCPR